MRVEMFRGRFCSTFAVRASKQGTYWNRQLRRHQDALTTEAQLPRTPILCSKRKKGKNSGPTGTASSLTTDPLCLTQKTGKWSAGNQSLPQTVPICELGLCDTLAIRPICFGRSVRGEVAEPLNAAICYHQAGSSLYHSKPNRI